MILVMGSSGTVGRELLREFTATGAAVRGGYRTRRPELPRVDPARFDLATGEGLDAALQGIERVFLLVGDMADQTAAEIRAVDAAVRAGVRRIVKLSVLGADKPAYSYARIHGPVERAIEASGMAWTFLRCGNFMQNFVNYFGDSIRRDSAFYLPRGEAREGFVDARDIARVAARVLLEDGHEGRAYDLLGPEALTYAQAAEKLSAAVGRTITSVDLSEPDFRKFMKEAGAPETEIENLIDMYRHVRKGALPLSSTAIRDVTGREPVTFDQFAREHAAAWKR